MKQIVSTKHAPAAIGPYSQAVISGGYLFASGQIPLVPETGELVVGDIVAETHRVMQNMAAVLEAAGLDFSDVVKTTVFLTDLDDFTVVNGIYGEYFKAPYPARSCIQVSALPKGVKIEAEMIAKLRGVKPL